MCASKHSLPKSKLFCLYKRFTHFPPFSCFILSLNVHYWTEKREVKRREKKLGRKASKKSCVHKQAQFQRVCETRMKNTVIIFACLITQCGGGGGNSGRIEVFSSLSSSIHQKGHQWRWSFIFVRQRKGETGAHTERELPELPIAPYPPPPPPFPPALTNCRLKKSLFHQTDRNPLFSRVLFTR